MAATYVDQMALRTVLKRVPDEVLEALDARQKELLARTLAQRTRHSIDLRVSFPWFGSRYYLTVFAGKDRRATERLLAEGQLHWFRWLIAYIAVAALVIAAFVTLVAVLYLVKSALGIDIFVGNSPLHALFEAVWPAR